MSSTVIPGITRNERFDAYCLLQEISQGSTPTGSAFGTFVMKDIYVPQRNPAFDHAFAVQRVCLWSPLPELRCGSDHAAEYGVISEPYGFAGNEAQQAVAKGWGLRFYRLPNAGFHYPGMSSFLWIVKDASKSRGVVQAMFPQMPLEDLYGILSWRATAPRYGRQGPSQASQLTIVTRRDADAAGTRFNYELAEAGRSAT